jgi:HEAT repeat protein
MGLRRKIVILFTVCIAIFAPSASKSVEISRTENPDSISKQVEEIFARSDKLAAQRKQRSREYLSSLPDEKLAEVYAKATAPQRLSSSGISSLSKNTLEAVEKDRPKIIEELLKRDSPLDEREDKRFRSNNLKLADELAALGPSAVPAISLQMGDNYRRTGHWALATEALVKMGPNAVESLIPLMDSQDSILRGNVAYVLSRLSDTRSTNVLLSALDDEDGNVRHYAIDGLIALGPKMVGSEKLITLLINHLQDENCLHESIQGLEQYGDERAIEPLSVIERFYVLRGKADFRYSARRAINAILRRAGKPVNEVSWEDYPEKLPTYGELLAAAQCPNASIRFDAISQLDRHKDEETACFLIGRIKKEDNYRVLEQIAWALPIIMRPSGRPAKSSISGQVMQEAFDAFLSIPETNQELSASILRACKVSARVDDFISPTGYKLLAAAITGARCVLFAASETKVHLDRIERFKDMVRGWCLSSRDQNLMTECYLTISWVARVPPETGETWSAEQREELMKQLKPLLDSPNPDIRLIECLGCIGDRRIVGRLIELLQHQDPHIRRFAAGALGQIRDPQALSALKHLVETDPYQYENGVYGVREAASEAIEKIQK